MNAKEKNYASIINNYIEPIEWHLLNRKPNGFWINLSGKSPTNISRKSMKLANLGSKWWNNFFR